MAKKPRSLAKYFSGELAERIVMLDEKLSDLRRTKETFAQDPNARQLAYKIFVRSLWANEGEHNVEIMHSGPLRKAFALAIEAFATANEGRRDLQVEFTVWASVPSVFNGASVLIPEEYWGKIVTGFKTQGQRA